MRPTRVFQRTTALVATHCGDAPNPEVSNSVEAYRIVQSQANARFQPLPKAGATKERTLSAVGCKPLFGRVSV